MLCTLVSGKPTDSAGVIQERLESGPLLLYVMNGVNVNLWLMVRFAI